MEENNFSFSPSQYIDLTINNKNVVTVGSFLNRPLIRSDLGNEVGSKIYTLFFAY